MPTMPASTRRQTLRKTFAVAAILAATATSTSLAQIGYGVDAANNLFSFNLSTPGTVTSIGNLGTAVDAIDFRPGTSTLYAIKVDSSNGNGSLFTINTTTGAASLVGLGFNSTALIGASSVGFDFNPTTLQNDGSIRIRLVGTNGANLRLNSDTGAVAATDGNINGVSGASTSAAAYTNTSTARLNGLVQGTALYYIDSFNNSLLTTSAPNAGTVSFVGALGMDVGTNLGFDIYTGASTNTAYLVETTGANSAFYYSVNLTTGTATSLGSIARDFTGGFAVDQFSAVPEPSSFAALAGLGVLGLAATRRRRPSA